MRSSIWPAVLIASATACGPANNESSNNEDQPLSPELHECEPYEGSTVDDAVEATFAEPNDMPTASFTVPDDAGGGYVEFTLTTENDELAPGVNITADGDDSGAVIAATAAGADDPTTFVGGFTVAPGQTYNLEFRQGMNAPSDEYPVGLTFAWNFTAQVDCYEPNDSADDAKQVPVGTMIEAFSHAGYVSNGVTGSEFDDWYKVVLNRPATIEAELVNAPGDHRTQIRFFGEDGVTQLAAEGGSAGGETYTVSHEFEEAGTFLMVVEARDAEVAKWDNDSNRPTFWDDPYIVDLREAE